MLKTDKRTPAIERGMSFICRTAGRKKSLRGYGAHLVTCFALLASTSPSPRLRRIARETGRNLALDWRKLYPALPVQPYPEVLYTFIITGWAADYLSMRDQALKERIRKEAKRFSAEQVLGFDPSTEPPPDNLPETCSCGLENPRGRKTCRKCRKRLTMTSRYKMWMDALGATFCGERYGVILGARYAEVLKWLPDMRPYLGPKKQDYSDFFYTVYAITHVVYTLNGYGRYNLSPRWLPHEFQFLKANLKEAVNFDDPDMVGEFLDSLKAFGLSDQHPTIRLGTNYLLAKQNSDGSWGDPDSQDIFQRYHATWAAIDGLRDYAWRGERLIFPKLQPLLEQWAKPKRSL